MFLHIGDKCSVEIDKIIGIFDLENTEPGDCTGDLLKKAEKENRVTYASAEIPKSFIITSDGDEDYIYISSIAAATLEKRVKKISNGIFTFNDN